MWGWGQRIKPHAPTRPAATCPAPLHAMQLSVPLTASLSLPFIAFYLPCLLHRYDALMDEYLEDSYQAWKQRQRMKGDVVKKRRRRLGDAGELRCGAQAGWLALD